MNEFSFVKLKDIGEIVTGNTPKTSDSENYSSNDVPFLKPSDFGNDNITMARTECFVSNHAKNQARILPVDSVAVTCIGVIGKVLVTDIECAFNQQINAIIPKSCFLSRYIAYAIMFQREILQNRANAAVVPIINKSDFSNVQIPICSFEKQCEIVTVLDKLSTVINLRQKQLEKLDELVKSRFIEMFGDPVANSKNWNISSLLSIGYCKNGMNFHTGDNGVDIRCLGVADFKNLSVIDGTENLPIVSLNELPSKDSMLKDGDIVFVRSNGNKALVGRCLLVYPHNIPTTYSGFCIRFRLTSKQVMPEYLLRVLKSDSISKKMMGRGANIQNLNQQILASLDIPIPPLDLQNQFAEFVKQTDKSKADRQIESCSADIYH